MWVFLGMETIANIKYRSHVDSDSCLLAVCRWLIPHEVAPQQSFTMLQPANAKVIIKNGTTKNNHIYFILQFDPLKHSINNSSCNLTYTPHYLKRYESNIMNLRIGTGLPNIQKKDLENFRIELPPSNVQKEIATCLTAIEHKILVEINWLDSVQKEKKHLLRQMFI